MKSFLFAIIFGLATFIQTQLQAQELQITLVVNGERVQTQEKQVFTEMQNTAEKFINNQEWTADKYEDIEKILGNIAITLDTDTDITKQSYKATVQIQSLRPVYGTDYETPLMSFIDNKWSFTYTSSDPLIYSDNTYSSELTSLLAYYAYIILGLDYDSFGMNGGTIFYEQAQNIANFSQQSGGEGWDRFGDKRDRIFLIEALMNPQYGPFREAIYEYHRLGMDTFESSPDEARKVILQALKKIQKVKKTVQISVLIDSFFDTKSAELINIFSKGDKEVIKEAAQVLIELHTQEASKYRKLLKNTL